MANSLRGSLQGYSLTRHASERMITRGFEREDILFILRHGVENDLGQYIKSYYIPQSPFYSLCKDARYNQLSGSEVIVSFLERSIITVQWRLPSDAASLQGGR